jgi:hypothetical protein
MPVYIHIQTYISISLYRYLGLYSMSDPTLLPFLCPVCRDVVCQLCLMSVEQKYRSSLSRKYKLPKLKYHVSSLTMQMEYHEAPHFYMAL